MRLSVAQSGLSSFRNCSQSDGQSVLSQQNASVVYIFWYYNFEGNCWKIVIRNWHFFSFDPGQNCDVIFKGKGNLTNIKIPFSFHENEKKVRTSGKRINQKFVSDSFLSLISSPLWRFTLHHLNQRGKVALKGCQFHYNCSHRHFNLSSPTSLIVAIIKSLCLQS